MMVAELNTDQFSLFPEARHKVIERQIQYYNIWTQTCSNLERAVGQIIEYDVREIVDYRFIRGNSRAATILRFSGLNYCDKTIDRKITEGVKSVANTILYLT